MKLINIGFGNMVACEKIISVVAPDSAPVIKILSYPAADIPKKKR